MSPNRALELLPVIEAFACGKQVEARISSEHWGRCHTPTFSDDVEYRIKPEPQRIIVESGSVVKPPIGPVPEEIWLTQRMWHLIERLAGYANQTQTPVDKTHLIELRDRIDEFLGNQQ